MKIVIADRDKRMLLILAIFFVGLGYYYLLLEPLYRFSEKSAAEVTSKKNQLAAEQVKIGQFGSWQRYHSKLGSRIAEICKWSKAPWADATVSARIAAIANAAENAGLKLADIKPIAVTLEKSGEKPRKEINKFVLEGSCSFNAFLKFIRNIYGMKITQFSLNADKSGNLRFSMQLESLPKLKVIIPGLKQFKIADHDYTIRYSPFVVRKTVPEETPEMRERRLFMSRLNSLKLEGIVRLFGRDVAIVRNPLESQRPYNRYHLKDPVNGDSIIAIKENEVWLMTANGKIGGSRSFDSARFLSADELATAMKQLNE